jgi:hypothetical protein
VGERYLICVWVVRQPANRYDGEPGSRGRRLPRIVYKSYLSVVSEDVPKAASKRAQFTSYFTFCWSMESSTNSCHSCEQAPCKHAVEAGVIAIQEVAVKSSYFTLLVLTGPGVFPSRWCGTALLPANPP